MSAYERVRLENIKQNELLLQQLGLSEAPQTRKAPKSTRPAVKRVKVVKEAPPLRVSLRTRGQDPDGEMAKLAASQAVPEEVKWFKDRIQGTIEQVIDSNLLNQFAELEEETVKKEVVKKESKRSVKSEDVKNTGVSSYIIPIPNGSVKVTPLMVYAIDFHPSATKLLAMVGEKKGAIGIVDISDLLARCEVEEGEIKPIVHIFNPHTRPVSKIQYSTGNKIFTSSYDGSIRLFDINKQSFEEIYVHPDESPIGLFDRFDSSLWFVTNQGQIGHTDIRNPKDLQMYEGSVKKLNSVSCSSLGQYICTAGLDNIVRVWDVRNMDTEIVSFEHGKSVNSAHFDHTGKDILSTSYDDTLVFWEDAVNSAEQVVMKHNNNSGRWVHKLEAVYRPYGEKLFCIGNMSRKVDLYNAKGNLVQSLQDDSKLTAIPAVNVFHPNPNVDIIASGNASGRLSIWTAEKE